MHRNSFRTTTLTSLAYILFTAICIKAASIYDVDGNAYDTITIGTQIWLKQNLRTTRLNDSSQIINQWPLSNTPAYSWYGNSITNKEIYGALYNWYAASSDKLCPKGWHVPTANEWSILETFLEGWDNAGGKLKEAGTLHWMPNNIGATNETNFTARPGGFRYPSGTFTDIRYYGYWWSSTSYDSSTAIERTLYYYNNDFTKYNHDKHEGLCVRCLMDSPSNVGKGIRTIANSSINPISASIKNQNLYINFLSQHGEIILATLLGRVIFTSKLCNGSSFVKMPDLPDGGYIITVRDRKGSNSKSIHILNAKCN